MSIFILFLYFPLLNGFIYFFIFFYLEKYQAPNTKDIYYPMYYVDINNNFTPELYYVGINNKSKPVTAINSNNLTHLLAALFIVVPLLNFVFSTASRQQKIKIWLHNCWNNFSKKWYFLKWEQVINTRLSKKIVIYGMPQNRKNFEEV